jgi:ABC-type multidrug transport system ATPase subunit
MDEATRCDRVALMQKGRILAVDTPSAITRAFDRPLLAVRADDRYRALLAMREYPHTFSVFPFGDVLHYTDNRQELPTATLRGEVTRFLAGRGLAGLSAEEIPATIEDSFMAYMGSAESAPAA